MDPLIIGITGNIASGKSSVARIFQEYPCALVDADRETRELYAEDSALLAKIFNEFGPQVKSEEGLLQRKKLGAIVFSDPERLETLNHIVHPVLVDQIRRKIRASLRIMNRVVVDAALIVELDLHREMDFLVGVRAPDEQRLARLMERNRLSKEDAQKRMDSQMPQDQKMAACDFVVENNGFPTELEPKVEQVWTEILSKQT